ncbi:MAG: glycosyltransferase [Bacillota bacterium]
MKKKVFISFTGAMEIGGIERSLISLLNNFDYDKYEVDLFLYAHRGPLFGEINKNVNILPEVKNLAYVKDSFKTKIKKHAWYSALLRLNDYLTKTMPENSREKIVIKRVDNIDKEYDLAIGFFQPFDVMHHKIKAKRKIGWIHTDYDVYLDAMEESKRDWYVEYLRKNYSRVDKIFGVSEDCSNVFINIFPEFKDKVGVIENMLDSTYVNNVANSINVESEMPNDGFTRLLTVGRYEFAKNMENIPIICSELLKKGLNVKWYIVGFGGMEEEIKKSIITHGMQNNVIMLGKRDSAYPYIKACDWYIQPSRYEGKAVVVLEAQMLCKPVIITDYPTSGSQLRDGYDGVIVPLENKACADIISEVLIDDSLKAVLEKNCKESDYSNSKEMNKIYAEACR